MTNKDTERKAVLVTGAARRIGAAICRTFHQQGFNTIIHCNQSLDQAYELAGELNSTRKNSASVLQASLESPKQVTALAKQALQLFERLDVLVNNASSFYPTRFGAVNKRQWDNLMDTNLRAAFFLSQTLAAEIQRNKGSIVNLLDIYADKPRKDYPIYSISKAGLKAMTKALAIELAPLARANGVSPGAILWPSNEKPLDSADLDSDKIRSAIIDTTALKRTGSAEEIAATVYFLAAEASYVTGQVIKVDGGRNLNL